MIRKSFCFIDGIGTCKESNLWQAGIDDWESFLASSRIKGISSAKKAYADRQIHAAKKAIFDNDSSYFTAKLPSPEMWRLYSNFRDEALFLDIETSGVEFGSKITVVGLSNGYEYNAMVRGVNLDFGKLLQLINQYKVLVTFNGGSFDLPMLNRAGVVCPIPHIDLKVACQRIGLSGGLKQIERTLGISRTQIVEGLHGGDALTLWKMYRATRDPHYLDILLEYNEEDSVNLRLIADHVCKQLQEHVCAVVVPYS